MKIIGNIINGSLVLIGFVMEGKASEFGEMVNDKVQRQMSLGELMQRKFYNSQLDTREGTLKFASNYNPNGVPLYLYDGSSINQIDNNLKVTAQLLVHDVVKGYTVESESIRGNYTVDNIIKLTTYFKPENFIVSRLDKVDKEGKKVKTVYLKGKGCRLSDLPKVEISQDKAMNIRKVKGAGSRLASVKEQPIETSGDLLNLYEIVQSCNGVIIKLPDEKYKAHTEMKEKIVDEFVALNVGEVGYPVINYNEKNLNANTNFRKLGNCFVKLSTGVQPVYTYTITTKSIFKDGMNYIKRFGVGVTPEVAEKLTQVYGNELITKAIKNSGITTPISSVMGRNDLVYFEVDTSKLSIMGKHDAEKYLLSNEEVYEVAKNILDMKAKLKVLKAERVELVNKDTNATVQRAVHSLFKGMSMEDLDRLTDAGIDVCTGAFNKREVVEGKTDKEGLNGKSDKEDVQIEIYLSPYNSRLNKLNLGTVRKLIEDGEVGTDGICTEEIKNLVEYADNLQGIDKAYWLLENEEHLKNELSQYKKKLWLHKVAMYTLGNERSLYVPDISVWKEKSSRSAAKVFESNAKNTMGLTMKLMNISMSDAKK